MKLFATMTILASNMVFAQGAPEEDTSIKAPVENACGRCKGRQNEGPSIEEGTKDNAQYVLAKSGCKRRK